MRAAVLENYRTPLEIIGAEPKELARDEVRIKTAYAGLSFTDRIIQQGLYTYQRRHLPLPYVPGFEASGTVRAVGSEVSGFAVGDQVVVLQRYGCFSSEITANTENLILLPEGTDLAWAASLPVNFFTASHALNNIVRVFPKSEILVTSAAGGVGGMLVQLAAEGHVVTGLVGSEKKKGYVKKLGAHHVHTYEEFGSQDKKFALILVASGKDLEQYLDQLEKNGKLVVYGFHSLVPKNLKQVFKAVVNYMRLPSVKPFDLVYENQTVSGFNIIHLEPKEREFSWIKKQFLELNETGDLPDRHTVHEYDFARINEALEDLADGNVAGKIVIKF